MYRNINSLSRISNIWMLLITFFVIIVPTLAHSQIKDVEGWDKARWGMTEDQILQTFKGRLNKLPKTKKSGYTYVNLQINDFVVEGIKCAVSFKMDTKSKLLKMVSIEPMKKKDNTPANFNLLKEMLTKKYGHPDYDSEDELIDYELRWHFPSTEINLSYSDSEYFIHPMLRLIYRPNSRQ